MKKFFALFGLTVPIVLLASADVVVPYGAFIVLFTFGGLTAFFAGAGALIFEFILAFLVQRGLTPVELLLGL